MPIVNLPLPYQLGISDSFSSYQDNPMDNIMRYRVNLAQSRHDKFFNFNRFQTVYPEYELSSLISYVFIVRPDLNLVSSNGNALSSTVEKIPFYQYMFREHKEALMSLCCSLSNDHHFIPFLQERVESFQVSDISLKYFEIMLPYTGFKSIYGGTTNESRSGVQFDITFREDNELNVTMFFYAWIEYIDKANKGLISPDPKMIYEKRLDYTCSLYFLVCAPDGKKILFWNKAIGGIPLNTPFSTLSKNLGGQPDGKVSISIIAPHYEPMNPSALSEFNYNSAGGGYDYILPYHNGASESIVGAPYITYGSKGYELRWRPRSS